MKHLIMETIVINESTRHASIGLLVFEELGNGDKYVFGVLHGQVRDFCSHRDGRFRSRIKKVGPETSN